MSTLKDQIGSPDNVINSNFDYKTLYHEKGKWHIDIVLKQRLQKIYESYKITLSYDIAGHIRVLENKQENLEKYNRELGRTLLQHEVIEKINDCYSSMQEERKAIYKVLDENPDFSLIGWAKTHDYSGDDTKLTFVISDDTIPEFNDILQGIHNFVISLVVDSDCETAKSAGNRYIDEKLTRFTFQPVTPHEDTKDDKPQVEKKGNSKKK